MIQFQNVSAGYAGRTVVREVSFTVPRGSVASLIGPNGQGEYARPPFCAQRGAC